MHPDYEYDKALHVEAKSLSEALLNEDTTRYHGAHLLAAAYIDLLERRGMPPDLKCYPSIQLQSGVFYDFINPELTPLDPNDIAAGLSKASRCTGQTLGDEPYVVGQHCCHASDMAEPKNKFKALMHDAWESVGGDCATPLKQLMPDYKRIERRGTIALANQFSLNHDFEHDVKDIDLRMAATEKRDIMPEGEWEVIRGIEPYDFKIIPWSHKRARMEWLTRFHKLYQDHLERLAEMEESFNFCSTV